jgi:hypothetical protein
MACLWTEVVCTGQSAPPGAKYVAPSARRSNQGLALVPVAQDTPPLLIFHAFESGLSYGLQNAVLLCARGTLTVERREEELGGFRVQFEMLARCALWRPIRPFPLLIAGHDGCGVYLLRTTAGGPVCAVMRAGGSGCVRRVIWGPHARSRTVEATASRYLCMMTSFGHLRVHVWPSGPPRARKKAGEHGARFPPRQPRRDSVLEPFPIPNQFNHWCN